MKFILDDMDHITSENTNDILSCSSKSKINPADFSRFKMKIFIPVINIDHR